MAHSLTSSDEDDLAREFRDSAHIEVGHDGCYCLEVRTAEQVRNGREEQEDKKNENGQTGRIHRHKVFKEVEAANIDYNLGSSIKESPSQWSGLVRTGMLMSEISREKKTARRLGCATT
jgi:hypothetical protein